MSLFLSTQEHRQLSAFTFNTLVQTHLKNRKNKPAWPEGLTSPLMVSAADFRIPSKEKDLLSPCLILQISLANLDWRARSWGFILKTLLIICRTALLNNETCIFTERGTKTFVLHIKTAPGQSWSRKNRRTGECFWGSQASDKLLEQSSSLNTTACSSFEKPSTCWV